MTSIADPFWRSEFPFSSHFAEVDGHRLHYVDEGQGEPLVFVHGNPTWCFYWRTLLASLRGRYRVIACDHLGCGFSDKPQQYDYSLVRHSQNLRLLLDHLKVEQFTLVGHDWGGAIGLHCGLLASTSRLQRVVLFNTGAFPPHRIPLRIAVCRLPLFGPLLIRGLNVFPRAALRLAIAPHHRWTDAQRQAILAPYRSWHDRVGIWRFVRDIPRTNRHPTHRILQQLQDQLIDLRDIPVAIIWGMQDWCFDASCLQRLVEHIPHAQVTRLPRAGHWVVEDSSREVLQVVQAFLQRNEIPIRCNSAEIVSAAVADKAVDQKQVSPGTTTRESPDASSIHR